MGRSSKQLVFQVFACNAIRTLSSSQAARCLCCSRDWLSAMSISACGLRFTDDAVRVAVGMRLGTEIGPVRMCTCGASGARRTHDFSCRHNPGKAQRHHYVNDLIWHSLTRTGIPSVMEPQGMTRSNWKRPDGLTLIP